MIATAKKALRRWGIEEADCELEAARENHVFRTSFQNEIFALRLHRPGYRSDAELHSELYWMKELVGRGMSVPRPIPAVDGQYLHRVDDVQTDVLTWLPGTPLGKTGEPLIGNTVEVFKDLGAKMAQLHNISDDLKLPSDFSRCRWDLNGLVGSNPVWGNFWENPSLTADQRRLFQYVRQNAVETLEPRLHELDFGLIHADMVRENILVDDGQISLIDFDDGGFGFRLFDVATALIKNTGEPNYPELREALITGYRSKRPLDTRFLNLFILLRAATYVGWVVERLAEDGSTARNRRFIEQTERLAKEYLDTLTQK